MPRNTIAIHLPTPDDVITLSGPMQACRQCRGLYSRALIHTCGSCVECCQCVLCPRCPDGIGQSATCEVCGGCQTCCTCSRCQHCHRTGELCDFCERGLHCGCCRRSATIHFVKRPLELNKWACRTQAEQGSMLSRRLIGAEIEVCGTKPGSLVNLAIQKWSGTVVSDGSLPPGGYEINTHPSGGLYYAQQIEEIYRALNASGLWQDSHAGCHIHTDARDFDYTDLYKLLCVYAVLEPGLYKLIPQNRRSSRYCIPCGPRYYQNIHIVLSNLPKSERNPLKAAILLTVYGRRDTREFKKDKGHDTRYRSLNVHSYTFRGTIEYRMPEGTVYPENVINYGMLYAHLMDRVKKLTVQEAKDYAEPFMRKWGVEAATKTDIPTPTCATTYGEIPASVKADSLNALLEFYGKAPASFQAWLGAKIAKPELQRSGITEGTSILDAIVSSHIHRHVGEVVFDPNMFITPREYGIHSATDTLRRPPRMTMTPPSPIVADTVLAWMENPGNEEINDTNEGER